MTTVLVVDDDIQLVRLVSWTLRSEGYEVEVAASGRQALSALQETTPDLMLLDLNMPGMNGREVYTLVRGAGYDGPIAICSAYGALKARAELGADAAISKPFEPEALVELVDDLTNGHS